MSDNNQNENEEIISFMDADFINSVDQELDNEPGKPLPTPNQTPDDKDEFDFLLDNFLNNQLKDIEDTQEELVAAIQDKKPLPEPDEPEDNLVGELYQEERRLYDAYINFKNAVNAMADQAGLEHPELDFNATEVYLRYRPSRAMSLNQDIYNAWTLMLQAQPVRLSNLPAKATDEQILEYAEKTTDENLQMALISYIEILIELEGCEISYNLRKAKSRKRKIERAIYEENQQRQDKINRFIAAIKAQNFPIDAERLVNNYFKTARKDPEGAQKMLKTNPATFAPIDISKLPARFFGMIKPKPEDGIRVNREIGKFMKTLKA